MAKTLYLHVGMPKCASTSIQGMLKAHADVFAEHGKFYDIPPRDETIGQGNVTKLLADYRAHQTVRVNKTLDFFLNRDTDVIMSSEVMIGMARHTYSDDLIRCARERGFETQMICYVRRQDHWLESDYKQHLKGGSNWTKDMNALIKHRAEAKVLNYHWMLSNWVRSIAHKNITLVPLLGGQGEHYALERFLIFLGMDPALAAGLSDERQNVSPPTGLIEPMRYLKMALMEQGMKDSDVRELLLRFLFRAPLRVQVPPRRFLMSLQARRNLLDKYAESNAGLARDFHGGVPVFDDVLEEESTPAAHLGGEAATVLASWVASDKRGMFPEPVLPVKEVEPPLKEATPPPPPVRRQLWPFGRK